MDAVIEAIAVSKRFMLYHNRSVSLKERFLGLVHPAHRQVAEEFWALRGISATILQGEALGIVGRNGSGKSTLLKLIAGIHRPTDGRMLVSRGAQIATMIELGLGFHADLSGTENVYLNAAIHGLSRQEIDGIYDQVVDYSGLRHFMDVPLKNYSSGMSMRLAFAIAAHLDPDILLLDEIFAVGDEDFQKQCVRTMQDFGAEGRTIVFVSHMPVAVQAICSRVLVLDHGELFYDGPARTALDEYHRMLQTASTKAATAPESLTPAWAARSSVIRQVVAARAQADGAAEPTGIDDPLDQFYLDFLKREGLGSHQWLLDVGNGLSANRPRLARYLDAGHYVDVDGGQAISLADLPRRAGRIDVAFAPSLFPRLSLNLIARCVAAVIRTLTPSGRFYASYFETSRQADFEPLRQDDGSITYADTEPYHYSFELLSHICSTLGADATRVGPFGHPRGEVMIVITPRHESPRATDV